MPGKSTIPVSHDKKTSNKATVPSASNSKKELLSPIFFLLFYLFFFNPLNLYLANHHEFLMGFLGVFQFYCLPMLLLFLPMALIAVCVKGKALSFYLAVLCTTSLLIALQSSLLLRDYGVLDGRNIAWEKYHLRGIVDMAIWIFALAFTIKFYQRLASQLVTCVNYLFIAQLGLSVYLVSTQADKLKFSDQVSNEVVTVDSVASFSRQENVLHLVLDSFQSDIFEEIVIGNASIEKALQGFTFYIDTLGTHPYTQFAVPAFLSEEVYENNMPKHAFTSTALSGDTVLNVAVDNGYELDLFAYGFWMQFYKESNETRSFTISPDIHAQVGSFDLAEAFKILDLSFFKAAPHWVKKWLYNQQKWRFSQMLKSGEHFSYRYFVHDAFLSSFISHVNTDSEQPVYKYMHLMGPHNPLVVKSDCSYAGGVLVVGRESAMDQSRCVLLAVINLFNKLRDLGVYDNTTIFMHADHGGWLPSAHVTSPVISNRSMRHVSGQASPLLAIKAAHSSQPFIVSKKQVSLIDLPATISDMLDWETDFNGVSISDIEEGEDRIRTFYYYPPNINDRDRDYTGPILEYEVHGERFSMPWKVRDIHEPPNVDANL